jgi:lipopolysaccharide transport system permease protein
VSGARPRSVEVLAALTASDLRARYGRGGWRAVKWLVDPFAVVGVYLVLVTFVLKRGHGAAGLSLACAVVPFQLVMASVINVMHALNLRGSIILNSAFPRSLIPLSGVLTETIAFAGSLGLLALMMGVYGIAPTLAVLWLPVVVAVNVALAVAAAYPAALFGLWFGDLREFLVSFARTLFFLAPGLVPLAQITGRAHDLVQLNPLSGLFEAYRSVLLYGHAPGVAQLLYPAGVALVALAVTLPVFRGEARHLAKVVE